MKFATAIHATPRIVCSLLSADEKAERDRAEWRNATGKGFPAAIHDESDGTRILRISHDGRESDWAMVAAIETGLRPAFHVLSASREIPARRF